MTLTESDELKDSTLKEFIKLSYLYTGISINEKKKSMVQSRIRPRIRQLSLKTYEDYLNFLNTHQEEKQEFINLITTNETYFFRTPRVWQFFNEDYLPQWIKNPANKDKTLKIWSAASSSGEEVYTIGVCCEEFKLRHPSFKYEIVGTDICTEVLSFAQKGLYNGRALEVFKKDHLDWFNRHMVAEKENFTVSPQIKINIKFHQHNLFDLPKMHKHFDIIWLRNVLIYFEPSDQEKVLNNISLSLVGGGTLIIGESESLSNIKTAFTYKKPLIYINAL